MTDATDATALALAREDELFDPAVEEPPSAEEAWALVGEARGWKPWVARYLEGIDNFINVMDACRSAGVNKSTVARLRNRDEAFKRAEDDARDSGLDRIVRSLYGLSTVGDEVVKTTVVEKLDADGKVKERITTTVNEKHKDTQAAFFLLKRWRPEYREAYQVRHTGGDGGAVQVQVERQRSEKRVEELLTIGAQLHGWSPPEDSNGNGEEGE